MKNNPLKISGWKIVIPFLISVGVSSFLILKNFHATDLARVNLTPKLLSGLFLAAITVLFRDVAFAYKIRLSSGKRLSWKDSVLTILMWEFAACISPKIGEAALVVLIIRQTGLSLGRSTAMLLINSLFDNAAFIFVISILFYVFGSRLFLLPADCLSVKTYPFLSEIRGLAHTAIIGYGVIFSFCIFLYFSLFIFPNSIPNAIRRISSVSFFSAIKTRLQNLADDISLTAHEYKNQSSAFWIALSLATLLNWISRYMLVCALAFGFGESQINMLEVFARQYTMWVFMIIPTTPGSSGVAEILFMAMNCEFFSEDMIAQAAVVWRLYSYYIYLIIGIIIVPYWSRKFLRAKT